MTPWLWNTCKHGDKVESWFEMRQYLLVTSKNNLFIAFRLIRSSRTEVFLGKGVMKICSKFTGEHPCQSAILLRYRCSVSLLYFLRTPFLKNNSVRLLLIDSNLTKFAKTCTKVYYNPKINLILLIKKSK